MKLGFITNALAEQSKRSGDGAFQTVKDVADWAAEHGFSDIECGPSLPLEEADYEAVLDKGEIGISTLIYCRNYLSTDEEEAKRHISELERRIVFAGRYGIEKVVTSTGIDKTIEEGIYDRDPNVKDRANMIRKIPIRSMDKFLKTFDQVFELAEKYNVKICFENCPLMGNIAISPVMWKAIFERTGSDKIGLAYDPSHLIWEFIDPYSPIEEFSDKIIHFHAKDTLIHRDKLVRGGILTDFSWWEYKIPGSGELDWKKMFKMLKKIGYNGVISVEHEDRDFEGSTEAVERGLLKSKEFLEKYI